MSLKTKESKYVHCRAKINTDYLKKKKVPYNSFHLIECMFTQCVRDSVFDSRRSTFFTGEWTLAGVQVLLQLVLHLQIGL